MLSCMVQKQSCGRIRDTWEWALSKRRKSETEEVEGRNLQKKVAPRLRKYIIGELVGIARKWG